jgi:hypothetical protein
MSGMRAQGDETENFPGILPVRFLRGLSGLPSLRQIHLREIETSREEVLNQWGQVMRISQDLRFGQELVLPA